MITLDDILNSKKPQTRKESRPISGMGDVQIFELTYPERIQFINESIGLGDNSEEEEKNDAFGEKWVWRLMSGPDRKPKEGEVAELLAMLSHDQIEEIIALAYTYGAAKAEKK